MFYLVKVSPIARVTSLHVIIAYHLVMSLLTVWYTELPKTNIKG